MNRPSEWFLRSLLAGAAAACFLAVGVRAFANPEEGSIQQSERVCQRRVARHSPLGTANLRLTATQ